jgi:hypothetical protein
MNNPILDDLNIDFLKSYNNQLIYDSISSNNKSSNFSYEDSDIPIVINKDTKTINKLKKLIESTKICACLVRSFCECKELCDCEDDVYYSTNKTELNYPYIKFSFAETVDLLKKEYYIKLFTFDQYDNEVQVMHIDYTNMKLTIMPNHIFTDKTLFNMSTVSCSAHELLILLKKK